MNRHWAKYQEDFDRLYAEYDFTEESLAWCFDDASPDGEDVADIAPCHYISDFAFLKGMPAEERDCAILSYVIKAWNDVRDFGIKARPETAFTCFIDCFESDYQDCGLLIPTMAFVRPASLVPFWEHFEKLSRKPSAEFSKYVAELLQKISVAHKCIVCESADYPENYPRKDGVILRIDFPASEGEKRIPLPRP